MVSFRRNFSGLRAFYVHHHQCSLSTSESPLRMLLLLLQVDPFPQRNNLRVTAGGAGPATGGCPVWHLLIDGVSSSTDQLPFIGQRISGRCGTCSGMLTDGVINTMTRGWLMDGWTEDGEKSDAAADSSDVSVLPLISCPAEYATVSSSLVRWMFVFCNNDDNCATIGLQLAYVCENLLLLNMIY